MLRKTKTSHHNEVNNFKENSKKLWAVVGTLIRNKKPERTTKITSIRVGDAKGTERAAICDALNKYFVNVLLSLTTDPADQMTCSQS